ncbi:hypothetical protein V6N11_060407 [Hibiscus sabdariffa]|uniref:Uncharacterized protein n=1 Tax=Hibiscus sabdariffa TaxID=183260 RepID=A0ABR2QQK6_9ROSI
MNAVHVRNQKHELTPPRNRTQRQQNLKERSCTEAAPNEKTQNGAEKTSAEKQTSAEILGRGRKRNSIRPTIGSE